MSEAEVCRERLRPEPMPENIRSAQPGGGFCVRVELAWGAVRRAWLRRVRPAYVRRMAQLRWGDLDGCPFDPVDPRDLKYFRCVCEGGWAQPHDPFRWRDRLPVVRWGLVELLLFGAPLLALIVALAWLPAPFSWLAIAPAVVLGLVVYFFRNPRRRVPQEVGLVVAPADGRVVEVTPLEHDPFIGGPAWRIGIFLSIVNVHVNRAPERSRVIRLEYEPGKFLNAASPASARENENLRIYLEAEDPPHRRMIVRQISGLIARRIVCDLAPGQVVRRGETFGMIKFGSRTELTLPAEDMQMDVQVGDIVRAGRSVVARFEDRPGQEVRPE